MYDKADMLLKAMNSPPLGGAVVACRGFLISEGVACCSTLVIGVQQVGDQAERLHPPYNVAYLLEYITRCATYNMLCYYE